MPLRLRRVMTTSEELTPTDSVPTCHSEHSTASWRDQVCDCQFWVKYSLFVINFLVWTAGSVMAAIGVWARLQKEGLDFFDHVMTDPAYMLIAVGSIMFFISIFGCVGALRENSCLLKMFILSIIVLFAIQVVAAVLAFVLLDRVEASMTNYMKEAVVHYQDNDHIRVAIDSLQRQFYCCGAASYDDWELNPYYNCSSSIVYRCGVPHSCCRIPSSVHCGFDIRQYQVRYADQLVFTKGCIESLMVLFKDNLVIIGLIALSVGLLELFSILLASSILKTIITHHRTEEDLSVCDVMKKLLEKV